jgi:hypothetical protein
MSITMTNGAKLLLATDNPLGPCVSCTRSAPITTDEKGRNCMVRNFRLSLTLYIHIGTFNNTSVQISKRKVKNCFLMHVSMQKEKEIIFFKTIFSDLKFLTLKSVDETCVLDLDFTAFFLAF